MDCIFCKIIKKEIPCDKIYEDNDTLAFLDINPINPAHILVIPKQHYETIEDIPEDLLNKIIQIVKKISTAILKQADGATIAQSNKSAGGQVVPHIHFHIIPRYKNDNAIKIPKTKKYKEGEASKIADKIKSFL